MGTSAVLLSSILQGNKNKKKLNWILQWSPCQLPEYQWDVCVHLSHVRHPCRRFVYTRDLCFCQSNLINFNFWEAIYAVVTRSESNTLKGAVLLSNLFFQMGLATNFLKKKFFLRFISTIHSFFQLLSVFNRSRIQIYIRQLENFTKAW